MEGTFVWDDGTPFDYNNWGVGFPDNVPFPASFPSIQIFPPGDTRTGQWDDLNDTE